MTTEPVSLAEAKSHLRVSDDDPYITYLSNYITAARQSVENYLNATVANRSRAIVLDAFPGGDGAISLPNGPVTGVTEIAYIDTDGTEQTVADHIRVAYSDRDVITPAFGESWPTARDRRGAVTITYTAGMMTGSPSMLADEDIKAGILLTLGDIWEHREGQIVGQTIMVNPTVHRLLYHHRRALGV